MFHYASTLKAHVQRVHIEELNFQCHMCEKAYKSKGHLTDHIKTHTDAKNFECNICHKKFNLDFLLKRHMIIHSEENKYECEICKEKFKTPWNRNLHKLKVHRADSERHACSMCKKIFSQKSSLHRHEATHSEDLNFECDECTH